MRIEAPSLQEAFARAADELQCSVTELEIKVIQHPRAGLFGFFKKPAVIEAIRENCVKFDNAKRHENRRKENNQDSNRSLNDLEIKKNKQKKREQKQPLNKNKDTQEFENFFKDESIKEIQNVEIKEQKPIKKETKPTKSKSQDAPKHRPKEFSILDDSIIDTFNQSKPVDELKIPPSNEVLNEIKQNIIKLFKVSDFNIDSVDVFAYDDETIQVCLDGADAALLIGKEGHRYKALSYVLFNWINLKYNYSLRLEIAQFLKAQEESARQYATVLAQKVHENGRVQSRVIDGVGLKIILDELRSVFPNKYVGVKNTQEGKCVVVNEFYRK